MRHVHEQPQGHRPAECTAALRSRSGLREKLRMHWAMRGSRAVRPPVPKGTRHVSASRQLSLFAAVAHSRHASAVWAYLHERLPFATLRALQRLWKTLLMASVSLHSPPEYHSMVISTNAFTRLRANIPITHCSKYGEARGIPGDSTLHHNTASCSNGLSKARVSSNIARQIRASLTCQTIPHQRCCFYQTASLIQSHYSCRM
jgi:hypothetical protein